MGRFSGTEEELRRLEQHLGEVLKPVKPRPEFRSEVKSHLDLAAPFIQRRQQAVQAARLALLAIFGLFGGILVLLTGFKLIARLQGRPL